MHKKELLTAAVIIAILMVIGRIFKSKKMFNEQDARHAILKLKDTAGADRAALVEKIMRLETRHFRSEQYTHTGSAGMLVGAWGKFIPKSATNGEWCAEVGGKKYCYIVWKNVDDFAQFLSAYIDRHNGDWAQWNSTNPDDKKIYADRVNAVTARFV